MPRPTTPACWRSASRARSRSAAQRGSTSCRGRRARWVASARWPPNSLPRVQFTPSHRGGSGPPLVLLHGFTDTWRTWELVLERLERHHDVLAPTLPGHAGGPRLDGGPVGEALLADAGERFMDEAGLETGPNPGNPMGGGGGPPLPARGPAPPG